MSAPRLSVVAITWNEIDDIRRCLDALDAHPAAGGQEVIVVDNGSEDGTVEMLAARPNPPKVIENRHNHGVTVARNQGMRLARGRYVAMLDSDAYVHPGALETMCAFLDANPDVGLVGPRLVFEDGTIQMSCRTIPSPLALVASRAPGIPRLHDHRSRRRYLMMDDPHDRVMDVGYLLGAVMMFRREPVERIGGFDERFGFSTPGGYGFDDADWALRFRADGWRVVYLPDAVATHGYRRRLVGQPLTRANFGLAASYLLLKLKHTRASAPRR